MTHNDIYTKYMIEYDKTSVTSSYPSMTKTEIAAVLNKAYLALIGQKYTGNNTRQVPFEGDNKAISDLQPLIVKETIHLDPAVIPENVEVGQLDPSKFLYFVQCTAINGKTDEETGEILISDKPIPTILVSHDMAKKFFETPYNKPWIKVPVCYIEDNRIYIVRESELDPEYEQPTISISKCNLTYIKKPTEFDKNFESTKEFELNEQMAEELISLAIIFTLENVESPRLNTKTGIKPLEA